MKKLLLLILCFLSICALAQPGLEKARLEKERQQIQSQIQEIQSNYNKVKGLKKESLAKLAILQRKLQLQDRLIGNINKEIHNIDDDIYLSNLEIYRLQVQLDTLKAQYARSVVYAYKNNSSYDFLNFIFSANNFNDALRRISYLKSYRAYRQEQVNAIKDRQKLIANKKTQLLAKQSQKKSALQDQRVQLNELANQKKEKDVVVSRLKSQEKELSKQLAVKKKRDAQLKNQIAAVVRRAVEAAKKEAESSAKNSNTTANLNAANRATTKATRSYLDLNAKDVALNASFEKNKGILPWPVDNGVVTIPYGRSKVGGLGVDNQCLTISTPAAGTPVKAVFDGEVSMISNLGDGMMVTIRHGKYFTSYSNLSSTSVTKGYAVKRGDIIGKTGEADDGTGGQVDFWLQAEFTILNPQPWLRR